MSNHIIIGTAGHIDHGKTALIKSLTNYDCDTHSEEKRRGITINLGFSHLKIDDLTMGIIDVPGHKDFINRMAVGASGINFVLFIVAANSGIMPQTVEHLKILDALGVDNGIIVLTKCDTVDQLLIEIAKEELKSLVKDTFLNKASIIEVSSKTGNGIDKLKSEIKKLATASSFNPPKKKAAANFRMYIDRSFKLKGVGSIIAGSAKDGSLHISDEAYLHTDDDMQLLKIKGFQKYDQNSEYIEPGERAAVSISGFKDKEKLDGALLSDTKLSPTHIFDARLIFFDLGKTKTLAKIKQRSNLTGTLIVGSKVTKIRIKKLFTDNNNELQHDEISFSQLTSETNLYLKFGDKFIIRDSANNRTLGHGMVIDPSPLFHVKKTEKLYKELKNLFELNGQYIIDSMVSKYQGFVDILTIAKKQNLSNPEIKELSDSEHMKCLTLQNQSSTIFIDKNFHKKLSKAVLKLIKLFHSKNPLVNLGISLDEIVSNSGITDRHYLRDTVSIILNEMAAKKLIKKRNSTWCIPSHKVNVDSDISEKISYLENLFKQCRMSLPLIEKLKAQASNKLKISEKQFQQIIKHLLVSGKLCRTTDSYIHTSIVNSCRTAIICYLKKHDSGITVANFRDLTKGNRKICLELLAIYDKEGTTYRDGDFRFLDKKNRAN